jgi:protocatechuate 3,4-dioxygenase, beta subunit
LQVKSNDRLLTRREMLGLSAGVTGFMLTGSVFGQIRSGTPEIQMGPFYPVMKPLDQDADLTTVAGSRKSAEGKVVHVYGQVVNESGKPVSGARIEIWQANSHGRYTHSGDPNKAPLDPNFSGFAIVTSDTEGRYRFKTIKPGAYPVSPTEIRPPHIHVDVMGKHDRLVSQMFFPDEPLNERDLLFRMLNKRKQQAVVAKAMPATKEIEAGAILLNWDIVLYKG